MPSLRTNANVEQRIVALASGDNANRQFRQRRDHVHLSDKCGLVRKSRLSDGSSGCLRSLASHWSPEWSHDRNFTSILSFRTKLRVTYERGKLHGKIGELI